MELALGQPRRLVTSQTHPVRTDFRLLECSEELLNTILAEGVVIKGEEHEEAVLCTADKTFAVKYVETTNLQLLIAPASEEAHMDMLDEADEDPMDVENTPPLALSAPGLQTQLLKMSRGSARTSSVTVAATNQAHFEVVEVAPRLAMLEALLSQRPYDAEEEGELEAEAAEPGSTLGTDSPEPPGDAGHAQRMYTLEELQGRVQVSRMHRIGPLRVQASNSEILSGLQSLGAVQLGKHWRLVAPAYLGSLLELILSSAQQEGYSLSAVPAQGICASLHDSGCDEAVVLHCLAANGTPLDAQQQQQQQGGAGAAYFALDESKVCAHFASKLLAGGRHLPVAEFLGSWQAAVPDGMRPSLEMLRGKALVLGKGPTAVIKHFAAEGLPKDPARRFAVLFSERPKWEASELEPYIADLKVPGLSSGALLLKYTRAAQSCPSEPVTYSAR